MRSDQKYYKTKKHSIKVKTILKEMVATNGYRGKHSNTFLSQGFELRIYYYKHEEICPEFIPDTNYCDFCNNSISSKKVSSRLKVFLF